MRRVVAGFSIGLLTAALAVAVASQSQTASQKTSAAPASTAAEIALGKQIYMKQCSVCHFANSTAKKIGPGMKGVYPRGKFAAGGKVDDESMRKWIYNGGKNMPGYQNILKPGEVRDLLAYLHTL